MHNGHSYEPGSSSQYPIDHEHKNQKADILSSMHNPDPYLLPPEPILPPAIILSPIQWSLDDQIAEATRFEPALLGSPDGKLYMPTDLRLSLMDSVHTFPGSGHPGSQ